MNNATLIKPMRHATFSWNTNHPDSEVLDPRVPRVNPLSQPGLTTLL